MVLSRRPVLGWLGALAGSTVMGRRTLGLAGGMPGLGLNTWSLRSLTHDEAIPVIIAVMRRTGMTDCQLLFSHAEPAQFDPGFASLGPKGAPAPTPQEAEAAKQKAQARTAWRKSVPLSYFTALRGQFERNGLRICAYAAPVGGTAPEVDRTLLMAKSLGASVVNTRLAEGQTDLVAAAAARHRIQIGLQGTDVPLLTRQLQTSSWLRADPDIGDLTRAGIDAPEFIRQHLASLVSVDLKDTLPGGGSVPFGTGAAHMPEVLQILTRARSPVTAYIDCDYPGTGRSEAEVETCVRYARSLMASA